MDKQKLTEFFNVLDGWLLSRVYQPLISDSNARSPRALCEFFSIGCIFSIFACIHAAFIEHLTDVMFFKGLLLIAVSATYFLMGQQAASAGGRKMLRTSAIGRATRATFVVASTMAGARIGWGMILGNLGVTWFLDLAVQLLFMSAIYSASCDSAPPLNLRRRSALLGRAVAG